MYVHVHVCAINGMVLSDLILLNSRNNLLVTLISFSMNAKREGIACLSYRKSRCPLLCLRAWERMSSYMYMPVYSCE